MLRLARDDDEPFLREMLCHAAVRPGAPARPATELLAEPRNARFVDGWGRPGDLGLVAEAGGEALGAAWIRRHEGEEVGPGYAGPPLAQLAIAVVPAARGRGWGRRLLQRLLAEADGRGFDEVQLTVGLGNEVAVRLYEAAGFAVVASDGRSARMARRRADLRP